MSWSLDLFVDAKVPLQQFVRAVESACDIKFMRFAADDGERYEYRDPLGIVCLWDEHGLENDRGMNLEDYRYEMNVRPYRTTNWEKDQSAGHKLASRLFEQLKSAGRYRLLLVEELQKPLQEFDPQVA